MSKLIGLSFAAALLILPVNPVHEKFAKYKAIEAYEVRPGILMMPKYSAGEQVCEIGLQKLHYSPEIIRLDSSLSREEIDQVFDELVPANERGPRSMAFAGRDLIVQAGGSLTTIIDFENVSIQIYREASSAAGKGGITVHEIIAMLKWKNRTCQVAQAN